MVVSETMSRLDDQLPCDRQLENPEPEWERKRVFGAADRSAVVARLGVAVASEEMTLLSGGLANECVKVGEDRVIRIYLRDKDALQKEATLLRQAWEHLRVPRVLDAGEDFLVLEHVPHRPLAASHGSGRALGAALREVHQRAYEQAGFLGADLTVSEPMPRVMDGFLSYVSECAAKTPWAAAVLEQTQRALDEHRLALDAVCTDAVLLHGDFKVSNLHATCDPRPLVLDWEFAYAGPALMDAAQLLRWGAPVEFREGFESAYRECGGRLPKDWARWARALDSVNLAGLLAGSRAGSRRAEDIVSLLTRRLQAGF